MEIANRHGIPLLCEQLISWDESELASKHAERILERIGSNHSAAGTSAAITKALVPTLGPSLTVWQLQRATTAVAGFILGDVSHRESFVYNLGAVDALVPHLGSLDSTVRQNALVAAHMLCSDVTGATVRIEACGGRTHLLKTLLGCAGDHEKATALDLMLALPGGRSRVPCLAQWLLQLMGWDMHADGDSTYRS